MRLATNVACRVRCEDRWRASHSRGSRECVALGFGIGGLGLASRDTFFCIGLGHAPLRASQFSMGSVDVGVAGAWAVVAICAPRLRE